MEICRSDAARAEAERVRSRAEFERVFGRRRRITVSVGCTFKGKAVVNGIETSRSFLRAWSQRGWMVEVERTGTGERVYERTDE